MKTFSTWPALLAMVAAGALAGCSHTTQSPDVSEGLRRALDQAGLQKVSIAQDREKGVVTLSGNVAGEPDKKQAESIAASMSGGQVVSDQIAVLPPGGEGDAMAVNTDLDKGIEQNLDAALIEGKLHDFVKYAVKARVVTLTGEVASQAVRQDSERIAAGVPNVHQVVNELQIRKQKATTSE